VEYAKDSIRLHQKAYILRMLERFGLTDSKGASKPAIGGQKLNKSQSPQNDEEKKQMAKIPYRALTGSLLYAARATRPDISYAVNTTSQFNENPGDTHWKAGLRCLSFLSSSSKSGAVYHHEKEVVLKVFSDSDWGNCEDTRRSISGYFVSIAGGPICWQSRKQRIVALSSCEAEFIALAEAVKSVLWLIRFLAELKTPANLPVIILVDNKGAMALSKNPVNHGRTKHIDIRFYFLREHITAGTIDVTYVHTDENVADIFTKAVPVPIFRKLSKFVVS
jgi:hypothetical protein